MDIIRIFEYAVEHGASDVILSAGSAPLLRIDGSIERLGRRELTAEDVKSMAYSVIDKSQVARFEQTHELDFSISVGQKYRFRGNVAHQRGTITAVFRHIPSRIPSFAELALPQTLEELCSAHSGLFLITGATGMGKSTTLASMIAFINATRKVHVITIEDPIEFVHTNRHAVIEQRELGTDTNSFDVALRQALRQSPDVIMVGEMRDLDTMATAITAAETGHLVFATLHTRDASQSIDRVTDSFPPHQQNQIREQLSVSLLGVLSQRLFARIGGGRVVCTELLINNSASANLIREQKVYQLPTVIETNARTGMHTFERSLKELVSRSMIEKVDAEKFLGRPIG
ncbi:MAG: PilT/PilU family type 4a pilus ATPase [Candidatus Brocadiia bacterium]